MREFAILRRYGAAVAAGMLVLVLAAAVGCKQKTAALPDAQVQSAIQAKLAAESALAGQDIHVTVLSGVATLSGTASNEASRELAANEAGDIAGVKTVVNNLTVQPQTAGTAAAPPATATPSGSATPTNAPAGQTAGTPAAAAPPPPPQPVVKTVTLKAGTIVPVRITETLNTKTAQTDDVFHGALAANLISGGVLAVPRGAAVTGRVTDAKEAAHFKGSAELSLELTRLTTHGQRVDLVTDAYTQKGAGRGKNTAEKAGGGAAFGAIIGALAGGGKGAAIGGLAGAGAGTGINVATRGQQVVIPSETVLRFRLQTPVTVRVRTSPADANNDSQEPVLHKR